MAKLSKRVTKNQTKVETKEYKALEALKLLKETSNC